MTDEHPPRYENASEQRWEDLVLMARRIRELDWIDTLSSELVRSGDVAPDGNKMLRICLLQKMRLQMRIANLVDEIVRDPYWDDLIRAIRVPDDGDDVDLVEPDDRLDGRLGRL